MKVTYQNPATLFQWTEASTERPVPSRRAQLLTHNMLMSPGTHNGFPLRIEVEQMEEVEAEFNGEFTARMVSKIEYRALLDTVASVSDRQTRPRARVRKLAIEAAPHLGARLPTQ